MHYDDLEQVDEYEKKYNLKATKTGRMSCTEPNLSASPSKQEFDPEYRYAEYIKKVYTAYMNNETSQAEFMKACRPEPKARKFALLRVFKVYVPGTTDVYLWRLRIFETPWFGVMLHKIIRPDPDKHMHDHPWPFFSWILKGGYDEQVGELPRIIEHRERSNKKRADEAHKIVWLDYVKPVWTLVFRGKRCRTWGFHTEEGWIPWHIYLNAEEKQ